MKIEEVRTSKDVEKYYYENMQYDRTDQEEEKQVLKSHKLENFKHLYRCLLKQEPSRSYTKSFLLELFQVYYDAVERSKKI